MPIRITGLALALLAITSSASGQAMSGTGSASIVRRDAPRETLGIHRDSARPAPPRSTTERFRAMLLPAGGGSAVGLLAGLYIGAGPFYNATGCCGGGDDPGLESGLIGALVGATLGSAGGAMLVGTREDPVSWGRALLGATLGIASGVLAAQAGGAVGDFGGVVVGFSVGQGVLTSAIAAGR